MDLRLRLVVASSFMEVAIPLLGIDLQDGFQDDEVAVSVNGEVLFRIPDLSTKLLLGFAHTESLQVPEGPTEIIVDVPSRGVSGCIRLGIHQDTYVGITLLEKEVQHVVSLSPFNYM